MFTGLVEIVGTVRRQTPARGGLRLTIETHWPDDEIPDRGDSVAVNGACLTALDRNPDLFSAEVSPETVRSTLLGELKSGDPVNLERALRLGDRLGGHIVQGHVDAIGRVLTIQPESGFARWTVSLPPEIASEIARKGSIAIDGVSLTVASVSPDSFDVALIPETLRGTTLHELRPGARVHLESDVLAKYVSRRLAGESTSLIDEVFGKGR